jgi:hypothetical protein
VAVGAVAGAYHASSGRLRSCLRKLDYYSIGVSSARLRAAVGLAGPRLLERLLLALMPLRPTLVVGANVVAVEVGGAWALEGAPRCALAAAGSAARWGADVLLAAAACVPPGPAEPLLCALPRLQVRYIAAALRGGGAVAGAWLQHIALGALAMSSFAAEDKAIEADVDWLHAVWHCCAAASIARLLPLLRRQEQLMCA